MQNTSGKFDLEYFSESEYSNWDEFVKTSPQGSFFNTTKWLEILSFVNHRPFTILASKTKDKISGGIVFLENKKWFWNMVTPVYLLPFNGPIFENSGEAKYQKTIADHLKISRELINRLKKDYDYIALKTHYSQNDMRSLQWSNFKVEPTYSYLIELKSGENIAANFNQSLRKKLRKSELQNIRFIENYELDSFVSLYKYSYHRHTMTPPLSENVIIKLISKIMQLENARMYFAEIEGKKTAARIVLEDGLTIYDLLAGSDDQSGLASSFLVAEIMKIYAEKYHYFDFLGADHPEVEQFKRGFGGKLVHGFYATSMPSFILSQLLKIRESSGKARRNL